MRIKTMLILNGANSVIEPNKAIANIRHLQTIQKNSLILISAIKL